MISDQISLLTPSGVTTLAAWWFGVALSQEHAETIASKFHDITGHGCGCLDDSTDTSVGPVIWLKSRCYELGYLKHDGAGTPEIRVFCLLHFEPCEPDADISPDFKAEPNYARSSISRSPLARIEPIDRVAARLVHLRDDSECPYCKRRYRNGAALRLHAVESHGLN